MLLARDRQTGERVAIKMLRTQSSRGLRRFRAEFDAAATIVHRNVVSLYELDAQADPWFIVMEAVDGVPFESACGPRSRTRAILDATRTHTRESVVIGEEARASAMGPASPLATIARRLMAVCDGLEALHERGLLHLDLKPANVLIERDTDRVVIVDLGLSHHAHDACYSLAGTPAYISPELLLGAPPTAAADRYALGVMLFESVARRWPFVGRAAQILAGKREHAAPSLRSVCDAAIDPAIDELCQALLARDPHARPSLSIVRETLARWVPPEADVAERRALALRSPPATTSGARLQINPIDNAADDEARAPLRIDVRCNRSARVPFATLDALARATLRHLDSPRLHEALDALMREECDARSRVITALASALDELSRALAPRPLRVQIDAAHEADDASVGPIIESLSRMRTRPAVTLDAIDRPSLERWTLAIDAAPSLGATHTTTREGSASLLDRSPRERALLALIAAAHGPVERSTLRAAMPDPATLRATERALRIDGWLTQHESDADPDGALDVASPAIAKALRDEPNASWIDRRMSRAVERSAALTDAHARLDARAGQTERATQRWISLAQRAEHASDAALASARWREALALTTAPHAQRAMLDAIARNEARRGRASAAADALMTASHLCDSQLDRLCFERRAAEQMLCAGRIDEGRSLLESVLSRTGVPARCTVLGAMLEPLERGPLAREQLHAGLAMVAGVGLIEPHAVLAMHVRNTRLAASVQDVVCSARATAMGAMIDGAVGAGREKSAQRAIRSIRAMRGTSDADERMLRWLALASQGTYATQRGRFCEGSTMIDRAEAALDERDPWSWERTVAAHFRHWALYYQGAFGELARSAPALVARAHRSDDRFSSLDFRTQHSVCAWLMADDAARVEAALDEAIARWPSAPTPMQRRDMCVAKTEIALYEGAFDRALSLAIEGLRWDPRTMMAEGVRIDSHSLRARAAIAAIRAGERSWRASAALRSSVAALTIERAPWARALAVWHRAEHRCAIGQPSRALLVSARDALDSSGMRGFARCASDAIRAIDGDTRDRCARWLDAEGARDATRMRQVLSASTMFERGASASGSAP